MKKSICCLLLALGLSVIAAAPAQRKPWPPVPHFVIKENYTRREAKITQDYTEYVKFLGRTPQWPRHFATNYLEGKSFEALNTSHVKGTCVLAAYASNGKIGEEYTIFSLKRLNHGTVSEAYYESKGDCFYGPLISPDGNTIVLREGIPPDDHGMGYKLVAWDLLRGELWFPSWYDGGDGSIMYPKVEWSPGGRYLSYLRGGDTFGGSHDRLGRAYEPPYSLYVCDLTNRQNYRVMKDAGLSWSWTYRGQLLFGCVPQEQFEALGLRQVRPSVYTANAADGAPRKLFDGGYFAHESPDGQWIAFCDWPGQLIEGTDAPKAVQESTQRGLFLFHKPTAKRLFVQPLQLSQNPVMQWSPDSKSLYLLEGIVGDTTTSGTIYKIAMGRTRDVAPKVSELSRIEIKRQTPVVGGFSLRRISPDGRFLYFNVNAGSDQPQNSVRSTLTAVDTRTGNQTAIARMTNVNNENFDWDWHDDSGRNAAFAAAQKVEAALSVVRAGNTDADPEMAKRVAPLKRAP